MAHKYTFAVLAISACFLMATVSASAIEKKVAAQATCSRSSLNALEDQIKICTRNVPAQQFAEPSWQCARTVTGWLQEDDECDLSVVPDYLEDCLYSFGFIGKRSIQPAVACIKNAIDSEICC
ncbi:uncharacterized protein LOC117642436 isoform X2 [Thrips palmi]|uniref:Uncharacterized protein LOC117642436 isoform X2 n=1 Tax=Thrips palmi TaxID=161013 RepID=A0A6P8YIR4_THRPL|nr:uncharacterized protein LOC117642436 isoform X2 [Thrips palmi]